MGNVFGECHAFCRLMTTSIYFAKRLANTNVYLYRLTKDSILFEWLSKVVTPDGTTLPLVYIILYVVDLVFVLNIQVILYINATRGTLKMCISSAVVC